MLILVAYFIQASEAIILDYNEFKQDTVLPFFTVVLLALTSAILKVISDTYIFILFIRCFKFFFRNGMNKWKTLALLILVFTISETLFVTASKLTYIIGN